MDSRAFLDFLKVAERLKCNTRHSYTSRDGMKVWQSTAGVLL